MRLLLAELYALICCGFLLGAAQPPALREVQSIPLAGVRGRIDHMSIDVRGGRLFVSALGNHTLEIIGLRSGKVVKTLSGLEEPQGVLYVPGSDKIFVDTAGDGMCRVYDGASYRLLDAIRFGSDADDIRFDTVRDRVYLGYGDAGGAGIGVIDPAADRVVTKILLPRHPEAFSLEETAPRIFVNIPSGGNIIAVADERRAEVVSRWRVHGARENFPMAIDRTGHRLFVVTRSPARLIVFDTASGRQLASLPCVGDADDAYYDASQKLILISGGEGFVDVFQQASASAYRLIQRLKTSPGARTSLFVPQTQRFYLSVPSRGGAPAEVRVYRVQ